MAVKNLNIKRGTTFGPIRFIAKRADGTVVPLAGFRAYAEARQCADSAVVIDFAPVIEDDDEDGIITIPKIEPSATRLLPACNIPWDLILEDPDGNLSTDPIITGNVQISKVITQPQ